MATVTITIYIEASAAVRAGSNVCGATPLRLTAEDLASLTGEQRDTLGRHFEGEHGPRADGPHWGDPIWQCIRLEDLGRHGVSLTPMRWPAFADLPTLRTLLDIRRRVMFDSMARADATVYTVKIGEGSWSAPMNAADSLAEYKRARNECHGTGRGVKVWRTDGVCVAFHVPGSAPNVDVAAQKLWHRAAAGPMLPRTREIEGAS